MPIVSIGLFKQHVRADDFSADDEYLAHLLEAAEAYALRAVNRTIEEVTELGGGAVPADFAHAIMLIGGHWYNQREAVSGAQMAEVPYTLQALLKPYRKLVDDVDESGETQIQD